MKMTCTRIQVIGEKTHPSVTPSTKHTCTGLESNAGLHNARPATNHLSQGMVFGMVLYVCNAHYMLNFNSLNMQKQYSIHNGLWPGPEKISLNM